jgi:flagellar biosynthesis GTPase FlhF
MKIKNVTAAQMEKAMAKVNRSYASNVQFNRFEAIKNGFNFTLRVVSSKGLGHRLSMSGRRLTAACWHVHRDFMRAIFDLSPTASLVSCQAAYHGKADFEAKYPDTAGINIGSMMQPMSMEEACACR